jgi:hypothetical protein
VLVEQQVLLDLQEQMGHRVHRDLLDHVDPKGHKDREDLKVTQVQQVVQEFQG